MAQLPNVRLPEETLEALESFAKENDMLLSDAIRVLLAESPRLISFASKNKLKLNFRVKRGGRRIPKDVQAELDALRKSNPND